MISINITKRDRKRRLRSGATVTQTRYVVNYRDPRTGKRKQLFFERQKDAQLKRGEIAGQVQTGTYSGENKSVTIGHAVHRWLESRKGEVKDRTLHGYRETATYITGPLLIGTPKQRAEFTSTARKPEGTRFAPMLGDLKLQQLTTSEIRAWHKTVRARWANTQLIEPRCCLARSWRSLRKI
jgi:integrase